MSNCNQCTQQKCGCLRFKVEGTYLLPYLGYIPLEPVDLSSLTANTETETQLALDVQGAALVYTGESAANGESSEDRIAISSIAALIDLNMLRNVDSEVPVNGALLAYDGGASKWRPNVPTSDTLVTAIGYNSDGELTYQDVTALTQAPIDSAPRVTSQTSVATLTFDTANFDQFNILAQASSLTIASPGVAGDGTRIIIRIKDNGTARAITWNSIFRAVGVTVPTSTVANKQLYAGVRYCAPDNKWDILAIGRE